MLKDITLNLFSLTLLSLLVYTLYLSFKRTEVTKIRKLLLLSCSMSFGYLAIKTLISSKLRGFGYVEPFYPLLEVNIFELIALLLSTIFCFAYLKKRIFSRKLLYLVLLIIFPLLYNSIERSSQILASDEGISVVEYASVKYAAQMGVWGNGALRFSYLTIGTIMSLFKPSDFYSQLAVAKMLHWLGGVLLIIYIFSLLQQYFLKIEKEEYLAVTFILFMLFTLVAPMNVIAWKIAQYDLYSMFLAVIALLYLLIGYLNKNLSFAIYALIVSVIGSQEKLNVAPFIIVALVLTGYLSYHKYRKLYMIPMIVLVGIVLSTAIVLLMYFTIGVVRDFAFPTKSTVSIFYPLVSWCWPLVSAKISSNLAYFNTTYTFYLLGALLVISTFLAFALLVVDKYISYISTKHTNIFVAALLIVTLFVGVWGTFNSRAYESVFVPAPAGTFGHEKDRYANYTWYEGAYSSTDYTLKNIAFYYATFVNAIPTVFWLLLLYCIFHKQKENYPSTSYSFLWDMLFIACIFAPLGYAMTSTWLVNRYYDLFIYIIELYILVRLYYVLRDVGFDKTIKLVFITFVLIILEVLPFAPVYVAFRPIWSTQFGTYFKKYELGRSDISWMGWGEEIMLAQRKIFKLCVKDNTCGKIRIYANYRGSWIFKYKGLQPNEIFRGINYDADYLPPSSISDGYTENDYFILTRAGLKRTIPLPGPDVPAAFTLSYRGYIQTWVYRGDVLKTHGIDFVSPQ